MIKKRGLEFIEAWGGWDDATKKVLTKKVILRKLLTWKVLSFKIRLRVVLPQA